MSDKDLLIICLISVIIFLLWTGNQDIKEIKDFIYSIFTDDDNE